MKKANIAIDIFEFGVSEDILFLHNHITIF